MIVATHYDFFGHVACCKSQGYDKFASSRSVLVGVVVVRAEDVEVLVRGADARPIVPVRSTPSNFDDRATLCSVPPEALPP